MFNLLSNEQKRLLRAILAKHSSESLAYQATKILDTEGVVNLLYMTDELKEELSNLTFIEVEDPTVFIVLWKIFIFS